MSHVFHYHTLLVELDSKNRSLIIALNRPDQDQTLSPEVLFELETVFNWVAPRFEIQTVLMTSSSDHFSLGWDQEEINKMSVEKIKRITARFQKLITSLYYLPQTLVLDFKYGAKNAGLELSAPFDLRLAKDNALFEMTYLENGLPPQNVFTCLANELPESLLKNAVLGGTALTAEELRSHGFLLKQNSSFTSQLLSNINKQSIVSRVQTKKVLLDKKLESLSKVPQLESRNYGPIFLTEDWKKAIQAQKKNEDPKFTTPKELAEIARTIQNFNKNP